MYDYSFLLVIGRKQAYAVINASEVMVAVD